MSPVLIRPPLCTVNRLYFDSSKVFEFLEILGWYDTAMKDNNFQLDLARVDDWIKRGAKPSETVASLIRRARNPQLKPHHSKKPGSKKAEKKA